jgi:hypothetical protein
LGDSKSLRLDQNKPGAIEIPINGGAAPYGNLKVTGLPAGLLAELIGKAQNQYMATPRSALEIKPRISLLLKATKGLRIGMFL